MSECHFRGGAACVSAGSPGDFPPCLLSHLLGWDVGIGVARHPRRGQPASELAGEDSNLQLPDPKSGVLPIELPAKGPHQRRTQPAWLARSFGDPVR